MKKLFAYRCFSFAVLPILWFASLSTAASETYQEIEWIQLMPKDDLDALFNPPDYLADIEDGSEQDSIDALADVSAQNDVARRFQQALK
jgi:uncharacterized protein